MKTQDIPVRLGDAFWAEDASQLKGLTLKCGSKLDSIDAAKEQLKLSLVKDGASTHPDQQKFTLTSTRPGNRVYQGLEKAAKDVECILVYNAKTGGYELHPLGYDLRVLPPTGPPQLDASKDSDPAVSRASTPGSGTGKAPAKRKPGAVRAAPSVMRNIRKPERPISKPVSAGPNTPRLDSTNSPSPPPITSAQRAPKAAKPAAAEKRRTKTTTAKTPKRKAAAPAPVAEPSDDDLDDLANELEDVLEEEEAELAQRTSSAAFASSVSPTFDDGASSTSEEE